MCGRGGRYDREVKVRLFIALAATTLLMVILGVATWLDPLQEGLKANYFSTLDWNSRPARSLIDPRPSTESLSDAWQGRPPEQFSATWEGTFITLREAS